MEKNEKYIYIQSGFKLPITKILGISMIMALGINMSNYIWTEIFVNKLKQR